MKTSHFAAVVFVVIGIFGVWKIMQYKQVAEATRVATQDASSDASR